MNNLPEELMKLVVNFGSLDKDGKEGSDGSEGSEGGEGGSRTIDTLLSNEENELTL